MEKTNNVVLIGFMGTGKSTIARKLADRLGWAIMDSDQWIEASEGMSISKIFKIKGEAYFRQLESEAIQQIMKQKKQVIATGGGIVMVEGNQKCMMDNGLVVTLKADAKTIINRVSRDRNRPLLKGNVRGKVHQLLSERKNAYDFAHIQIDTSFSSIDDIVEQIIKHMTL